MSRRCCGLLVGMLSCIMLSLVAVPRAARAENNSGSEVPDLKQTLNFGLKARLPSEFEFIKLVVKAVDEKRIPRKTVLSTFNWARSQNGKIPFPYFQFAMQKQAKKIGVQL